MELFATECCVVMPENLQDWSVGERYGHDIIGDMNHWTCAYMDWNLFLDQNSGPGIADNPCAAPIILDYERQALIRMSSYYYIGHFSRYVKRGAYGVLTRNYDFSENGEKNLECCAFLNPGGQLVVIIMNAGERDRAGRIEVDGRYISVSMQAHSIGTLIVEL